MINARGRALAAANLMTQQSEPFLSRRSTQFTLASSAAGRRAHDAAAVLALHDHTSSLAAAVARAVVVPPGHPADTLSLCCSRHPSASRAAIDATPAYRERARMRERCKAGCVARTAPPPKRPRPLLPNSCRRRASRPCCLAKNRLTCPCQAQNAKSRRRRAARGRALDARRRRSPNPTDALAHRNSPRAGPRSLPSSAWSRVALPYSRLLKKARS